MIRFRRPVCVGMTDDEANEVLERLALDIVRTPVGDLVPELRRTWPCDWRPWIGGRYTDSGWMEGHYLKRLPYRLPRGFQWHAKDVVLHPAVPRRSVKIAGVKFRGGRVGMVFAAHRRLDRDVRRARGVARWKADKARVESVKRLGVNQ